MVELGGETSSDAVVIATLHRYERISVKEFLTGWLATIGNHNLNHEPVQPSFHDSSFLVKLFCDAYKGAYIVTMIFPRTVAWVKLVNTA